MDGWMNGPTDR